MIVAVDVASMGTTTRHGQLAMKRRLAGAARVFAEPAVWRAIEKLSAAPQERRRLTDEVREVIRDELSAAEHRARRR
jgi:hypothetical protein